jgi:hypothetical protein
MTEERPAERRGRRMTEEERPKPSTPEPQPPPTLPGWTAPPIVRQPDDPPERGRTPIPTVTPPPEEG